MPAKTKTPKETIKIRRLPVKGAKLLVPLEVTRTGRNTFDTADTITIRIPGASTPVTINAEYLLEATKEVIEGED
jgi:hypothetical protein